MLSAWPSRRLLQRRTQFCRGSRLKDTRSHNEHGNIRMHTNDARVDTCAFVYKIRSGYFRRANCSDEHFFSLPQLSSPCYHNLTEPIKMYHDLGGHLHWRSFSLSPTETSICSFIRARFASMLQILHDALLYESRTICSESESCLYIQSREYVSFVQYQYHQYHFSTFWINLYALL